MSFSNAAETAINQQIFAGIALPWSANSDLWLALYTSDPSEIGTAVTNEIAYTGYARVPLTRASDLTITGATVATAFLEQFPACTASPATATHVGIVTTANGAGILIVKGALSSSVSIGVGVTPQFQAGALVFTLD
jgi:hypothetical protein